MAKKGEFPMAGVRAPGRRTFAGGEASTSKRVVPKLVPIVLALYLALTVAGAKAQGPRQLSITLEYSPAGFPGDTTTPRVPAESPPGERVTLKATVKNISPHEIVIGDGSPMTGYSLTVTDLRGAAVPLSKRGKDLFSKDRFSSARLVMITLRPGDTSGDVWTIDRFYDFARPGRYLVTVRRDFSFVKESVGSNTVEVDLK